MSGFSEVYQKPERNIFLSGYKTRNTLLKRHIHTVAAETLVSWDLSRNFAERICG
jgi:hypothetical protein